MKRTTLIGADADSLAGLAGPAIALAEAEGLGAHARSLSVRLGRRR
jgi:histidinol dehydrogenase